MVARNRVEIRGTLATEEVWSTGITMTGAGGEVVTDLAELQTWADNAAAFIEGLDMPAELTDALGPNTLADITEVAVQAYGAVGGITAQAVSTVDGVDGTGTVAHPPQVAMVFSGRTGLAGGSRRGRNYWPALGQSLNAVTARVSLTDRLALVAAWIDFVAAMADAADQGVLTGPVVYSPTLDLVTPVTSYQVGDVLDTQRRRRDALVEVYTSGAYPPAP